MPDYKGLQVLFMQRSPIGSQFGNWIVERKLGHGGNGVVWRVVGTGNRVGAMKFLSPWMDDNGIYYFDRKRYARFPAFSFPRRSLRIDVIPELPDPIYLEVADS